MKSLISKAFVAIGLLFAGQAFAQYGYGTFGYNNTTRQWVPPGVPIGQAVNPVQVVTAPVVPMGGGFSNCQFIGAVAGGTIGSLNKAHTTQATILGAIAGGVIADKFVCQNPQGQSVAVPVTTQSVSQIKAVQEQRFCGSLSRASTKAECDASDSEAYSRGLGWCGSANRMTTKPECDRSDQQKRQNG